MNHTTPLPTYASVMADWLVAAGYTHCFFLAGGGCMHLINGFRSKFKMIPVVHEMTAGIAVEHFNECSPEGRAFALVTTGPGLTNIVTAIASGFTERRPMLVISGQVKASDMLTGTLRQRGVQEVDGTALTQAITVRSTCLREPIGRAAFMALVQATVTPHPGPVVIEVCLDVQGAQVDPQLLNDAPAPASSLPTTAPLRHATDPAFQDGIAAMARALSSAKRPVVLLGGLVSRQVAWGLRSAFARARLPVMTATSAVDRISDDDPLNAGRPGSWGGQRSANILLAQADVVVGVGVQWDLQQTGFNWQAYAGHAAIYQIYPDEEELRKGHPALTGALAAVPDEVLPALLNAVTWTDPEGWLSYVQNVRRRLPVIEPANVHAPGFVSPFTFIRHLTQAMKADDLLALTSSGGAFTGGLQVCQAKPGQYITTSPAFASMGFGLATAIGAAFAQPGQTVVHVEGDGGFAQNLQELAVVRWHNLPLKMFIMDNGGYGSIRATQRKFFGGAYVGCDQATGLASPDWQQLFQAYGIPARRLQVEEDNIAHLATLIRQPGPQAWIVPVDPEQTNFPAVSSKILPDGKMQSNPLYALLPELESALLSEVGKYLPS